MKQNVKHTLLSLGIIDQSKQHKNSIANYSLEGKCDFIHI